MHLCSSWAAIVLAITISVLNIYPACCYDITVSRVKQGLTEIPTDIRKDVNNLNIDQNKLTSVGDNAFSAYTKLQRIALQNNRISYISPTAFDNTVLEELVLLGNPLTTLAHLSGVTATLSVLYPKEVPLMCDYRLLWLKKRTITVWGLKCAGPPSLVDRDFNTLTAAELLASADPPVLDGNNSTCFKTGSAQLGVIYRKMVKFPDPRPKPEVRPVIVVGEHLQCGGTNGLRFFVNTADDPGTELCQLNQELRECRLIKEEQPTLCWFQCPCPVEAGGCQAGLISWNMLQPVQPAQICELLFP